MSDKEKKLTLPKEARLMMVSFLEENQVENADALSDEQILTQYNTLVLKLQEKVKSHDISAETKNINVYINANKNLRVNDKAFLMRLYKLHIPQIYLHLFRDEDSTLSDKELWKIVNKSGINPLENHDPNLIFKNRGSKFIPKDARR